MNKNIFETTFQSQSHISKPRRLQIIFLLVFLPLNALSQGIGPPAGMGGIIMFVYIAYAVGAIAVFFILKSFYKRVRNKRNFLIVVASLLLVSLAWFKGYLSFTQVELIENNPLEQPLLIVEQHDDFYFKFEDGRIFEFEEKYHAYSEFDAGRKKLQVGKYAKLEKYNDKGLYTFYGIGDSVDFYAYKNKQIKPLITLPLFTKKIVKNVMSYEGRLQELKPNWQASGDYLTRALTKRDCCEISWIEELINRKAGRNNIVNREKLFHRFYSFADQQHYQKYRKQIIKTLLIIKGADINLKALFGKTILHLTVDKIPGYQKVTFTDADKEYIQQLVQSGADLNTADEEGKIPLHYALIKKNFVMSELLVKLGSDINLKDSRGESAYTIAHKYYFGNDGKGKYFNITEQEKKDVGLLLSKMQSQ